MIDLLNYAWIAVMVVGILGAIFLMDRFLAREADLHTTKNYVVVFAITAMIMGTISFSYYLAINPF